MSGQVSLGGGAEERITGVHRGKVYHEEKLRGQQEDGHIPHCWNFREQSQREISMPFASTLSATGILILTLVFTLLLSLLCTKPQHRRHLLDRTDLCV